MVTPFDESLSVETFTTRTPLRLTSTGLHAERELNSLYDQLELAQLTPIGAVSGLQVYTLVEYSPDAIIRIAYSTAQLECFVFTLLYAVTELFTDISEERILDEAEVAWVNDSFTLSPGPMSPGTMTACTMERRVYRLNDYYSTVRDLLLELGNPFMTSQQGELVRKRAVQVLNQAPTELGILYNALSSSTPLLSPFSVAPARTLRLNELGAAWNEIPFSAAS